MEYIRSVRGKDPGIGGLKLWNMYNRDFPDRERVGRDGFADIVDRYGLKLRQKARKPKTTDSSHKLKTYPNLVRGFIPTARNQLWVSDITYIPLYPNGTGSSFCFLSLVTDAYSREIIGWALGDTLQTSYPLTALKTAMKRLTASPSGKCEGLIHHSDRGVQYASQEYINTLIANNISISMTESGDPHENAQAERINNTIKNELLKGMAFSDIEQARAAVEKAVGFYNNERPHMSIDMLTPAEAAKRQGEIEKRWHSYRDEAIMAGRLKAEEERHSEIREKSLPLPRLRFPDLNQPFPGITDNERQ